MLGFKVKAQKRKGSENPDRGLVKERVFGLTTKLDKNKLGKFSSY
jgi:hypothetical protein